MNQSIIFIIVIIFIAILIIINFFYSKKAKIKRKLKNAELKKIIGFKDNQIAKIVGSVQFINKPLISPLSYRKCAYYYVHVEEEVSTGKNSRWKTIIEEEVSSKFLIKDNENYAFINDTNLKCYIVQDKSYSSGFLNDAKENLEKYINSKGVKSEGFLGFNKSIRYKEGILENDEEIAVFGKGKWIDAKLLDLPEKYGKVLEITSNENEAVYLSDDPQTTIKTMKKIKYSKDIRNYKKRYRE